MYCVHFVLNMFLYCNAYYFGGKNVVAHYQHISLFSCKYSTRELGIERELLKHWTLKISHLVKYFPFCFCEYHMYSIYKDVPIHKLVSGRCEVIPQRWETSVHIMVWTATSTLYVRVYRTWGTLIDTDSAFYLSSICFFECLFLK